MKIYHLILSIVLIYCSQINAEVNPIERTALIELYNATGGGSWTHNNQWLEGDPCDNQWFGIQCNNNQISLINLPNNKLSGGIPDKLGNLSALTALRLFDNQLTGGIPDSLGKLSVLTELILKNNQITGGIPDSLGNLPKLTILSLFDNQLSGSIPSSFGDFPVLTELLLKNNQLSGSIPDSLGNLSTLTTLLLFDNQLSGSIPASLGNLSALTDLSLKNNQLSGSIPDSLGNLSALTTLLLFDNKLSGSIPESLGNLTALTNLSLSNNLLSGSIPNTFGNFSALTILLLFDNQLSGSIPESLGSLKALNNLSLSNNYLSGSLPDRLGELSALVVLSIFDNQLSGSIPDSLGNLSALNILLLSSNRLTGSIPDSFGKLSSLTSLILLNNQLSGSIPDTLGNLTNLTQLLLNDNQLTGFIPESLGNLIKLKELGLQNNQLSGNIPISFGNFTVLTALLLNNNQLGGTIPANLENTSLTVLNAGANKFTGTIPAALQHLLNEDDIKPPSANEIIRYPDTNQPLALIIAGKDEAQPALTKSVNSLGNFAYRTLRLKKIPNENILYLNYQLEQNPDRQGGNDIYAEPSAAIVKEAITGWAAKRIGDNQPLFLYMVGHGLTDNFAYDFQNSTNFSTLKAEELDQWLDQLQSVRNNPVIVIYDACYSGSFLAKLKATGNQKRINIASAEADKLAFFAASGNTSFSFLFWANTQKGEDIKTTFNDTLSAVRSITSNSQKPQLDDNADGLYDSKIDGDYAKSLSIGDDRISAAPLPSITELNLLAKIKNTNQLNISAKINYQADLIGRVWVTVISPTLAKNQIALVGELNEIDLTFNSQTNQYEGVITGLNQNGVYQIATFAQLNNGSGFTSLSRQAEVVVHHDNNPKAEVQIGNEIQVFIPNASFAGQNFQARLRLVDKVPNEVWLELVDGSIAPSNVPAFISAIAEEVSLDLSIPSIDIDNKNYRAFLEFVAGQNSLQWRLTSLNEN